MSTLEHTKRFILTGTPGSGKTSVITELEKYGHPVIHEAATDLITIGQKSGNMRPWEKPDFVDKILLMQKTRQMNATGELQFFDRSPFCTYALGQYLSQVENIEFMPSLVLLAEIERCLIGNIYQNSVFFCENLGFVARTNARKISYEDALVFEKIHLDVYKQFGFKIIMLPKKQTIAQRCELVLRELS